MDKELEQFIQDEFGISAESVNDMSRTKLGDFFDAVCDIEIEEALKSDPISNRGRLACKLEDYINDNLF